jgi:arylsulfatase A-like enzyme
MPYLYSHTPQGGGGWYRFDNAFINNPTCCPSRATILTGRYSHHTHVETSSGVPKFDESDTIGTRLHDAGYRTGYIGKYHLGALTKEPLEYIPPGWDDWQTFAKNTTDGSGGGWYFNWSENDNGTMVGYGDQPADYSTDVLRAQARHFIDRSANSGQPFFMIYAPRGPHNNWIAAPRHVGHYANEPVSFPPSWNEDTSDKPAWWAERPAVAAKNRIGPMRKEWDTLLSVDDAINAIHGKVQRLGLMRNTVIFFMADNGYSFGEHRWGPKRCVYDSCSRTPLYVKYGGHSEGWTFPQIVGNEDLAATFADLAGTSPPVNGDGQSFASMLQSHGAPPGWDNEELLRSAHPNTENDPGQPPDAWGIRTPGYMYAETTVTGEKELYDLTTDPYELQNVARDPLYSAVEAELQARMRELRGF